MRQRLQLRSSERNLVEEHSAAHSHHSVHSDGCRMHPEAIVQFFGSMALTRRAPTQDDSPPVECD